MSFAKELLIFILSATVFAGVMYAYYEWIAPDPNEELMHNASAWQKRNQNCTDCNCDNKGCDKFTN